VSTIVNGLLSQNPFQSDYTMLDYSYNYKEMKVQFF
jgi:hypothetical protein